MTAPRTQTTRAKGLFITNETAPLLGAVVEGAADLVDEGIDEGPDEVVFVTLSPPAPPVVVLSEPVVLVVPLEEAVVEVIMVLLLTGLLVVSAFEVVEAEAVLLVELDEAELEVAEPEAVEPDVAELLEELGATSDLMLKRGV